MIKLYLVKLFHSLLHTVLLHKDLGPLAVGQVAFSIDLGCLDTVLFRLDEVALVEVKEGLVHVAERADWSQADGLVKVLQSFVEFGLVKKDFAIVVAHVCGVGVFPKGFLEPGAKRCKQSRSKDNRKEQTHFAIAVWTSPFR